MAARELAASSVATVSAWREHIEKSTGHRMFLNVGMVVSDCIAGAVAGAIHDDARLRPDRNVHEGPLMPSIHRIRMDPSSPCAGARPRLASMRPVGESK